MTALYILYFILEETYVVIVMCNSVFWKKHKTSLLSVLVLQSHRRLQFCLYFVVIRN